MIEFGSLKFYLTYLLITIKIRPLPNYWSTERSNKRLAQMQGKEKEGGKSVSSDKDAEMIPYTKPWTKETLICILCPRRDTKGLRAERHDGLYAESAG